MVILKFGNVYEVLKRFKASPHFKFGIPFGLLVAGSFYYLNQTQSIKYEFEPRSKHRADELKKFGFPIKSKFKTLEEIYDEEKNKDLSQWENKRIPRPWEE